MLLNMSFRFFIIFCLFVLELYATKSSDENNKANNSAIKENKNLKTIQDKKNNASDNSKELVDIEKRPFPLLHEDSREKLFKSIDTNFIPDAIPSPLTSQAILGLEEWRDTYFMYIYNFTPMDKPIYSQHEMKGQISFRIPLLRNVFKSGGIFYFAFTDTFFFQVFNEKASSPVRDNDYQPEFLFTYPMNLQFLGGTLTEITTGWRHISNGEVDKEHGGYEDRSRGTDRWIVKSRFTTRHWGVDLECFFPVRFYPENPLIYKYLGSVDIKIFMRYNKHLADLTMSGFLRALQPGDKTIKTHGAIRLSYTYKLSPYYGVYAQYFVGYGDYLYEYDTLGHRIGIGFRFVR